MSISGVLTCSRDAFEQAAVYTAGLVQKARRRPLIWPAWQTLPVAGLDAPAAQSILYFLRKSHAHYQLQDGDLVQSWLQALVLAQVASDRLLHALATAQRNLNFWRARLRAGGHGSFLLLSRGPAGFAADLLERAGLRQQQQSGISASDRIEERIMALQLLSQELAVALAQVHVAADNLAQATKAQQQQQQQQRALAAVSACVQAQAGALQQLLTTAAQLQDRDSAVSLLSSTGLAATAGPVRNSGPQQQQQQQQQQQAALETTFQQLQQQLQVLSQLLHVPPADLASIHSGDAGAALSAASLLASQQGPLVGVPHWAAMPSSLQRHWIKYTLAAGLGVYVGGFLYRNSRLAGSTNLDTWVAYGVSALEGAWADHVVGPLVTVRDELFRTFRDRPSIVSSAEFEADKASLLRMLDAFMRDHPQTAAALTAAAADGSSGGAAAAVLPDVRQDVANADAVNRGMQVVMHCYESDVKAPIKGLVAGELARTLLIQVQRLKLDTEAAMLELDQILRANELSISLVAAVPALLLSWTLLRGLWSLLLLRPPPDARREATPCRLAMADLDQALSALADLQSPGALVGSTATTAAPAADLLDQARRPATHAAAAAAAQGMVLYFLFKVYREAQALYRLKDSSSRYSDWPQLSADLLSLVGPGSSTAAKLERHRRMLRTYSVLQP